MFGWTSEEFLMVSFVIGCYLFVKGAWGAWRMDLKEDEIKELKREKSNLEVQAGVHKMDVQDYTNRLEAADKIAAEWRTKYYALQSTVELKCPKTRSPTTKQVDIWYVDVE